MVEDFTAIGTLDLKKSFYHSGPSPMRSNELWTCPLVGDGAARAQAHGCQRSNCWSFEEEEEGIVIASDLVKAEGENLETPGYLRGERVRRDVGDLGSWVCPPWLARDETPGPSR